jgi:cell volume regulation protein A
MTATIIISICGLLLAGYVFDLTSSKTKIPAVILLLLLGAGTRQVSDVLHIAVPNLGFLLPVLGTVGLILIVLEGSLELELDQSKIPLIKKSFTGALLSLLALAAALAFTFQYFTGAPFQQCLANAIPFCVISSSVAIPTARHLIQRDREFVTYESSLSDILGVLLFNFVALNTSFSVLSFAEFGLQVLIIALVSFISTLGLAFLLNKIDHHIKYVPIVLLLILIYTVSKEYHLPSLLFILLFGLFLGNLERLKTFRWIQTLNPEKLDAEAQKFKELVVEATFLIRSLFFILFGYLIQVSELQNAETVVLAVGIVVAIFLFRAVQLKLSGLPLNPLLFLAPRGLITILLFLAVAPGQAIPLVNNSLLIQVVVGSALLMMVGMMFNKKTS